jgi:hypothetical protein
MVVVDLRAAEPGVPAPPDVAAGLRRVKGAVAAFDALSPTHRGELLRYIDQAKTPESRRKRMRLAARHLIEKHPADDVRPRSIARPHWTCPRCGAALLSKNQRHACRPYRIEDVFAGKPFAVRELFNRFSRILESNGPVKLVPSRDRITFFSQVRIAAVAPKNKWLSISMRLPRRVKDSRFRRIETIHRQLHVHYLRISSEEELDDEFAGWLHEAYELGSAAVGRNQMQDPLAAGR